MKHQQQLTSKQLRNYFLLSLGVLFSGLGAIYFIINAERLHRDFIVDEVGAQVVKLVKPSNHGTGGTGFAVKGSSGKVYTLTNDHVCRLKEDGIMHAEIPNTDRSYTLNVIEQANFTDLCVLEGMPGYTGLDLSEDADIGEEVNGLGHPLLYPLVLSSGRLIADQTVQVLFGINLTPEQCETSDDFRYIDVPPNSFAGAIYHIKSFCVRTVKSVFTNLVIYPGNSGSPVVNFWGNVVGVIFAGDNVTNYGLIIPLRDIKKFLSVY